jgi:hypothetical protein
VHVNITWLEGKRLRQVLVLVSLCIIRSINFPTFFVFVSSFGLGYEHLQHCAVSYCEITCSCISWARCCRACDVS